MTRYYINNRKTENLRYRKGLAFSCFTCLVESVRRTRAYAHKTKHTDLGGLGISCARVYKLGCSVMRVLVRNAA